MTEHTFKPGERAYHVVRREIVTVEIGDSFEVYKSYDGDFPLILPIWHPDVPERCREPKPKRKVEVSVWANVYKGRICDVHPVREDALKYGNDTVSVELRGSYEVDE